ncbi:MAG: tetratricopeptide repeat protein [Candidatus Omnitrophica bacterium]|nr:tetratricopeptide repeat protein [Candidatus Omnitrophota bacterium]
MRKLIDWLVIAILLILLIFLLKEKLGPAFYNKGLRYYSGGDNQKAIGCFKKAISFKPAYAYAHYWLACAYFDAGSQENAEFEFLQSIKYDSQLFWSYKSLANLYASSSRYPQAIEVLESARERGARDPEIIDALDGINFEYAIWCLNEANDAVLKQEMKRAEDLFKLAIELRPDFYLSYYALGYFYYGLKDYSAAEKTLKTVIHKDPYFLGAYKLLGSIFFESGRFEEAIYLYKQALSLNIGESGLYNDLGLALMNIERYEDAIPYLEYALRSDPENIDKLYSLASVYRDSARHKKAITGYQEVIRLRPDYPNVHNDLADIYLSMGEKDKAYDEYRKEIINCQKRLKEDINDISAMNDIAYAYCGINECQQALSFIDRLLGLAPDYQPAYFTRAKILKEQEKMEEALRSLERAKLLSSHPLYIERLIADTKKEAESSLAKKCKLKLIDIVYLKNGRNLRGKLRSESQEKVVLDVGPIGSVTVYRNDIQHIDRGAYD